MSAAPVQASGRPRRAGAGALAALTVAVLAAAAMVIAALGSMGSVGSGSLGGGGAEAGERETDAVSPLAAREIPPLYLRLYEQAGSRYGVSWAILAGIGRVECDHGRDPAPSCTQEGMVNGYGAGGPMQFLAATWASYGVDADGRGVADRWDPADAIYGAANYLRASGAPGDYGAALYAYNHADWYVADVESWARRYAGQSAQASSPTGTEAVLAEGAGATGADLSLVGESRTAVRFVAGERAMLVPGDGHLALVPAGVPARVQAMVVAGNELQELPYGPNGHPDPLGASAEDCSSTVNYVLYRSGVRPLDEILKDNPVAQDYLHWGLPGPGRWVSIYVTDTPTPHVFMVIAGLRLDTSHDGTDVGPNRLQAGPRWRILGYIPAWARWTVRHPPGL